MNSAAPSPARFGFGLASGLVLIAVGTVLAFENAGVEVPVTVTRLWPLLLVFVGAGRLAQRGLLRVGGHLLIYLGLFLLGLMHRPETTLCLAGPVGLLWLGVIITLRALRPAVRHAAPASSTPNASPSRD
ncbi:MAG: DUF5668 domain-containing protein [Holophagaceae bacterium]